MIGLFVLSLSHVAQNTVYILLTQSNDLIVDKTFFKASAV
jgi:hypothetical protein